MTENELLGKAFPLIVEYKNKQVLAWKADDKTIASIMADAERLMGTRKCLDGSWLQPPEPGTELWDYAFALLNDPSPFVLVNEQLISLSKLIILE